LRFAFSSAISSSMVIYLIP
jgi:hypothetical protein